MACVQHMQALWESLSGLWEDCFAGKGSRLNYRILKWRKFACTFASVPRALPLNLRPQEKDGDRGTQLLGRIVASESRSAIFQREPVS
jgi:hypothetical protein